LFASGPARAPYPGSGDDGTFPRSTGAGNGRVPDAWGPDVEDGGGEHDGDWHEDPAHRPGTRWLRLAAIVAVLLVAVVGGLIAYNLNGAQDQPPAAQGSTSSSPSASRPARTPVDIAAVSDFDPQGDPAEEHPELAPLAVDGQPGTAWQTLTYRNNPRLGGLKSGVGLLVDLGRASKVGRVRLTLLGTPTSVEILAAPDADTAPTSTDGLDRVAARDNAGERVTLDLADPVTTRYLVVWLTSLPPAPGGYQGRIAEIAVSS
jgi:hypothetical protein